MFSPEFCSELRCYGIMFSPEFCSELSLERKNAFDEEKIGQSLFS